jgi:HEAT repeat protein
MNPIRTSARRILAGAVASALLALPAFAQGPQELLNQGIAAYDSGDYETAKSKFRQILSAEPSNAEAMQLLTNSEDALLELLVAGGEWEAFANEILAAASAGSREAMRDMEAAAALAEGAFSDDFATRQQTIFELGQRFGPFGAPPLVRELGSDKESRRLASVYALSRMGSRVFLPVVTACFSSDAQVRLGALHVLNELGDARAQPVVAQMAADDPDGSVRALAGKMISGGDVGALHVEQAVAYMGNDLHRGLAPAENYGVLWTTDGRDLIPYEVPSSVVGLELAKYHLMGAIEYGSDAAYPLLAEVYAKQVAALRVVVETTDLATAQLNALRTIPHAEVGAALDAVLDENGVLAAEVLLEALDMWGANPPASVTRALESSAPTVRFGAALVLAQSMDHSEPIVRALGEALSLEATRIVHIVDGDAQRAQALADALHANGVVAVVADSGADGIVNTHLGMAVDAFVVADPLPDMYASRFVSGLRLGRFADTPVFVYGNEETSIDSAELVAELAAETVIASFGEIDGERQARATMAAEAASILVMCAIRGEAGPATDAMIGALGREDAVSMSCSWALGMAGVTAAAPALMDVLADGARSDDARMAAAEGLLALVTRGGVSIDASVVEAAMTSGGEGLATACAALIGAAGTGHVAAVVAVE